MASPRKKESDTLKQPPNPTDAARKTVTDLLAELRTLLKTSRAQYQALIENNRKTNVELKEDTSDKLSDAASLIAEFKAHPLHSRDEDNKFVGIIDELYKKLLARIKARQKTISQLPLFCFPIMDKSEELFSKIRVTALKSLRSDRKEIQKISKKLKALQEEFNAFYKEIEPQETDKADMNDLDVLHKQIKAEGIKVNNELRKFVREFAKRQNEDRLSDKIAAFKRIYHAIRQGQTSLVNSDFMADKKDISDEDLETLIEKQIKKFPKGRAAKAWQLAQDKTNQSFCNHAPHYFPESLFSEIYQISFEHSGCFKKSNLLGVSIFSDKTLQQKFKDLNPDDLYDKAMQHKRADKHSRTAKILTAYHSFKVA